MLLKHDDILIMAETQGVQGVEQPPTTPVGDEQPKPVNWFYFWLISVSVLHLIEFYLDSR